MPGASFEGESHRGGNALPPRRDSLLSAEGMVYLRGGTNISFCLSELRVVGIGRRCFDSDYCGKSR